MATEERENKIKNVIKGRSYDITVVLEDIYDPHNAAAVFRTCDAFGLQNVHLIFDKEKSFNPTKVGRRASSSANKWLDFHKYSSAQSCLKQLRNDGFFVAGTALEKESKDLYEVELVKEKIALVFGNEHRGLSDDAIKLCDELIKIPMQGMVQSLNLSVSAAITLFETMRQRKDNNMESYLSEAESNELLKRLIDR